MMKATLSWIRAYCPVTWTAHELEDRLTLSGTKVEKVEPLDASGALIEGGDPTTSPDALLTLEITTNRPDCLGIIGVAREVHAVSGVPLQVPAAKVKWGTEPVTKALTLKNSAADLCPRYLAYVIRGLQVRPSPDWLVKRLRGVGLEPVNNIVDVTNYILYAYSQPLHAFDYAKLAGRTIHVRRAKKGETIVTLDGKAQAIAEGMLCICDAEKPQAVAGVMGGAASMISSSTTDVLLECAAFAKLHIKTNARALSLHTDSSYRFERGTDILGMETAAEAAIALLIETGGTPATALCDGPLEVSSVGDDRKPVAFHPHAVKRLLNLDVPPKRQREILSRLGVAMSDAEPWACSAPAWRGDLTREVDYVEEIGRIHGLDSLPMTTRMGAQTVPVASWIGSDRRVRQRLAGAGCYECVTTSFVPARAPWAGPLEPAEAPVIRNPLGPEMSRLRTSVIDSLLGVIRGNHDDGNTPASGIRVFEIGQTWAVRGAELPHERRTLGIAIEGDLRALRGIAGRLDPERPAAPMAWRTLDRPVPGIAAGTVLEVTLGAERFGWIGQLDGAVAQKLKLAAVCVGEFDLELLTRIAAGDPVFRPFEHRPGIVRDFAFVVVDAVRWERLESAIAGAAGPLRESTCFLSEYRGKGVSEGSKVLAASVTWRAPDRTLTHEEIDTVAQAVVGAVTSQLGATLRGT